MSRPSGTKQRAVRAATRFSGRRSLLLGAAGALVACVAVVFSSASFSAQTANPGNSFSAAANFCPNAGTQTIKATADAYVAEDLVSTVFGNTVDMRVRSRSAGRNRRAYVRFNLPSPPAGCSMTQATLRLWATGGTNGRTIQVYRAASLWNVLSLTWLNQPGTTGAAATSASGTGWRTWDVTSQVGAMYSGTNAGFVVRDSVESSNGNSEQVYQATEGAPASQAPELVVTFG